MHSFRAANARPFLNDVRCIDNEITMVYTNSKKGEKIMATTNITMRIDTAVKAQLQELVSDLGLDVTTFFTMAAKQAIREQRIPFEVSRDIPNTDTLEALKEVEEMKKNPSIGKSYTDVDAMMEELLR